MSQSYPNAPYEIEPELRGPLPRRVRERPHMIATQVWLGRASGILLCLMCYLTSASLRSTHSYLRHQQVVIGTVDDKVIDDSGKTTRYNIAFNYNYKGSEGDANTGVTDVGYAAFQTLRLNGPIPVYYDDTNPSDWRLLPVTENTIQELEMRWYGAIALVTLASLGGLGWLKGYRLSRIRLLQYGEALAATVTARSLVVSTSGNHFHSISYKWKSPDGKWHATRLDVSASNYAAFPESTRFTVIRVPGSEFRCIPYSMITEAAVES